MRGQRSSRAWRHLCVHHSSHGGLDGLDPSLPHRSTESAPLQHTAHCIYDPVHSVYCIGLVLVGLGDDVLGLGGLAVLPLLELAAALAVCEGVEMGGRRERRDRRAETPAEVGGAGVGVKVRGVGRRERVGVFKVRGVHGRPLLSHPVLPRSTSLVARPSSSAYILSPLPLIASPVAKAEAKIRTPPPHPHSSSLDSRADDSTLLSGDTLALDEGGTDRARRDLGVLVPAVVEMWVE